MRVRTLSILKEMRTRTLSLTTTHSTKSETYPSISAKKRCQSWPPRSIITWPSSRNFRKDIVSLSACRLRWSYASIEILALTCCMVRPIKCATNWKSRDKTWLGGCWVRWQTCSLRIGLSIFRNLNISPPLYFIESSACPRLLLAETSRKKSDKRRNSSRMLSTACFTSAIGQILSHSWSGMSSKWRLFLASAACTMASSGSWRSDTPAT